MKHGVAGEDKDPGLISLSRVIEARGFLAAAAKVELHIHHRAPSSQIHLIMPGSEAHWFSDTGAHTAVVCVNPDTFEPAQHQLDYLLKDLEYEEIHIV